MNNFKSIDEKTEYLTGADTWRTKACGKIPPVAFSDGPAGLRKQDEKGDHLGIGKSLPATCYPAHSALARSWNEDLCREVGGAIACEAAAKGVDVLLAPAVNIKRNPLCGRNFEYFSEDGYLSGKLGAAYIKGVQSAGVGACVKHFAANNRERARMVADSVMDERTLREVYLLPFEIAVKEGRPAAVMTAYNRLNGVYCNENARLISGILRGEWGFDGITVSDWGGTHDRASAIKAGADLEMPACAISAPEIRRALENGVISEADVDACARRISDFAIAAEKRRSCAATAFENISERAAEECITLIKNDGVLPLGRGIKFAVLGGRCRALKIQGGGSSQVNATKNADIYAEFCGDDDFLGCAEGGLKALKLAKKADVSIVLLSVADDTEGADRSGFSIDKKQLEFLDKIYAAAKRVVCVLFCGSAVDTSFDEKASAVILAGLAGEGAARALKRALKGELNPSGKLAETFPYKLSDLPSSENFGKDVYGEIYSEGLKTGYRGCKNAKYAFGFGLSYTTFEYSDLRVDGKGARFFICNTGNMRGDEIAQLYISLPDGASSPHMRLAGFVKTSLAAGERREAFIPFDEYTFRSYDEGKGWVTVGGEYGVFIGASSEDIRLTAKIAKEGEERVEPAICRAQAAPYPVAKDKKGRPVATLSTPLAELAHCRGLLGRILVKIILSKAKKGGAVGGTMEYLPIRAAVQFARFNTAQAQGFLDIFNGRGIRGIFRILFGK